jgi:DNA-binding IclR family transcriptional regulator
MPGQRSNPTERVVRLLETLRVHTGSTTENGSTGLRFADLARAGGVSQATCHSILLTLADAGYVVRDAETRTYTLGPALVALGAAATASFPEVRAARPELVLLSDGTGLPVSAARVVDGAITVVDIVGGDRATLHLREGTRVPCAPPFGAIHVAWEPPDVIDAWIARASSPTLTPERLRAVVADHRRTHVAVAPYTSSSARLRDALGELAVDALAHDVRERTLELLAAIDELDYTSDVLADAEHLPVNTLTSPVFDRDGHVAFAVALHVADRALATTRLRELVSELRTATDRMTSIIGGTVADASPGEPFTTSPARPGAVLIGERP